MRARARCPQGTAENSACATEPGSLIRPFDAMITSLAKYGHSFLVGIQSNLVYRWNFAIRGFFSLFHLAVVFVLWGAAYAGNATIGGFALDQTITYFVMLIVLQFLIGAFNE